MMGNKNVFKKKKSVFTSSLKTTIVRAGLSGLSKVNLAANKRIINQSKKDIVKLNKEIKEKKKDIRESKKNLKVLRSKFKKIGLKFG